MTDVNARDVPMHDVEAPTNRLQRFWDANRVPLLVFFVTRAGLFLLVYLSLVFMPLDEIAGHWRAFPDNFLLDGWSRWDSGWYTDIASNGYSPAEKTETWVEGQENVAFFPGYPMLLRAGMIVFGNVHVAGIILSNLAFLAALVVLFHLVKEGFGTETAERTVILLTVFPFALFFAAVYSESLFLLAAASAFYFGSRGRWALAGLSCAAATATRLQGIALPLGLIILYLEQIDFKWRAVRTNILWLLVGFAGVAGYFLYLWGAFGYTPNDYLVVQFQGWRYDHMVNEFFDGLRGLNLESVLSGNFPANKCLYLLVIGIALILTAYVFRRVGIAYGLWTLASILISATNINAFSRYMAVVFPLFIALALLTRKESLFQAATFISVLLLSLFAMLFAHWYWVA